MNAIRRALRLFRDSPTYGRERASLLSGFTIGVAGLLLNVAVLVLVIPLLADPQDFREITENLEFGQILALILLGGTTAFATLLIPLRLSTVFLGPRVGRSFDQIVLSGISPLRYMIGKATSQNLYVALIVFLLLPYLVLCVALGGVDLKLFAAGVALVWLYCMTLALVTLWLSLYVNEIMAALIVVAGAFFIGMLGCFPLRFQPFVLTPMPALIHGVYSSIPTMEKFVGASPVPLFMACSGAMVCLNVIALLGIYFGPLYGIIQDNSTFGEVVRPGDSQRKRWFRFRPHIQRPSEIAFFYENRGNAFRKWEGLLRWGSGFLLLTILLATADGLFFGMMVSLPGFGPPQDVLHVMYLVFHGVSCVLAIFVFSHSRNSTYMRIPFACGWKAEVARLDTCFFLLFLTLTTAMSIATPFLLHTFYTPLSGLEVFSATPGRVNYRETVFIGTAIISCAALVIYVWHRIGCQFVWLKAFSMFITAALYSFAVGFLPFITGVLLVEARELDKYTTLQEFGKIVITFSPAASLIILFKEAPGRFRELPVTGFFVAHGVLLFLGILVYRWRSGRLRAAYPKPLDAEQLAVMPVTETQVGPAAIPATVEVES